MMKYVDVAVLVIYAISLIGLAFIWHCGLDPIVTVLGAAVLGIAGLVTYVQYKKLGAFSGKKEEEL
jgi:hypothetical protein